MKNLKLLLIAVILVGVAFMLQHGSKPAVAPDPHIGKSLVVAADIDGVPAIMIKTDQGQIDLKKTDGVWRLPGLHNMRADLNRIEELFQRLTDTKIVDVVSGSPQRHADLGVASIAADAQITGPENSLIVLRDAAGSELRQIYLGKGRQSRQVDGSQGFGNDGQYFRFGGDDGVYLLSNFLWLEKNQKNWLSKELLKLGADKISRLAWMYNAGDKETFSLARSGATDSLVLDNLGAGQQTKQSAVTLVTNVLAGLGFDEVIATDTPGLHPGLADSLALAVETFDGLKLSLLIGSAPVDLPGLGKMNILWLNADYSGSDAGLRSLADELSANAKKMVFALRENRFKPLLVKAADLAEAKPLPPPENASGTAAASASAVVAEQVAASHILIAFKGAERSEATRSEAEAKKLADELLAKIKKGEDFAKLAQENSDCPSGKSKSGSLGEFGRGMMAKEFEESAFSLKAGEISEVVKTAFGYHIIRRDK